LNVLLTDEKLIIKSEVYTSFYVHSKAAISREVQENRKHLTCHNILLQIEASPKILNGVFDR